MPCALRAEERLVQLLAQLERLVGMGAWHDGAGVGGGSGGGGEALDWGRGGVVSLLAGGAAGGVGG